MTAALRFADTPELRIGYLESGPPDGTPVILYHGFPDDARTWDGLTRLLAADGYRTIAPYVRGFGPTRFREGVERTGEIAALAHDVLALADALELGRFHYVGHDWGARAGYGAAVLAPRRLLSLTTLGVAYGTNQGGHAISFEQTRAYWYQWYFATPRGENELETNRRAFCRGLWSAWSPGWRFDEAEYETTADSFDTPDFVTVVLSSYRQRWGFVSGAVAYGRERERLAAVPAIEVPTLTLMGHDDGATLPLSAEATRQKFAGPYDLHVVDGSGHFVQRERLDVVARRMLEHLRGYEGA